MILEHAVKTSNVRALRQMLRTASSAVFEEIDKNGRTPLILACFSGNIDIIMMLLRGGASPVQKDNWGKSPLMYAIQRGHLEAVKALIAHHAHVLDRDDSLKTVQDYALACRNREILEVVNEAMDRQQTSAAKSPSLKSSSPYHFPDDEADEGMWPPIHSPGARDVALSPGLFSPMKTPSLSRQSSPAISRSGSLERSITQFSSMSRMSTRPFSKDAGLVCHESDFTILKNPLELARRGMIKELRAILPQAGGLTAAGLDERNELGRSPLVVACLHGQLEAMQVIIEAGGDVNSLDYNGKTCLFYAIAKKNDEAVYLLLEAGADIHQVDKHGRTPLMHACMEGNIEVVKALIQAGASYSYSDNKGRQPLMYAASIGNLGLINELLLAGADPFARDIKGRRADDYARSLCNFNDVVKLFRSYKAKALSAKGLGSSESLRSSVGAVSRLGRPPVPLSPFNPKGNISAKQLVRNADYSRLRVLLDGISEVSMNERDERGRTALMIGCLEGKLQPVQMLLEAGADVSIKDNQGKTVLFHAVATGNVALMQELIEAGADIHTFDSNGRDPLIQACVYGNIAAMDLLIKAGANVNAHDQWGKTALMYATGSGSLEAMQMLISAGADIHAVSVNGKRVSDYGYTCHNFEAIKRILKEEKSRRKRVDNRPRPTTSG